MIKKTLRKIIRKFNNILLEQIREEQQKQNNELRDLINNSHSSLLQNLYSIKAENAFLLQKLYESKIQLGQIQQQRNALNKKDVLKNIQKAEFKIFSQWGDDGIIQFLINYLDIKNKSFIEFGVENYLESNTRFLLINNNWKGLIFDGTKKNIDFVKKDDIYWKHNLTAIHAFITKKNINQLIIENEFNEEIGLLHIDIDGNDYWIWKHINCISPVIVIIEYNSVFGHKKPWTIKYKVDFNRTKYRYDNLYFGASLLALCDLAKEKGYCFIGCNSAGNNAYFIRNDKMKKLRGMTAKQGYVSSMFRESRNKKGELTYIGGDKRLKEMVGCEIYNTRTNKTEKITI